MSPVLVGILGWLAGLTVVMVIAYRRGRRNERYLRAWREEWAQTDGEPLTYYEDPLYALWRAWRISVWPALPPEAVGMSLQNQRTDEFIRVLSVDGLTVTGLRSDGVVFRFGMPA